MPLSHHLLCFAVLATMSIAAAAPTDDVKSLTGLAEGGDAEAQ